MPHVDPRTAFAEKLLQEGLPVAGSVIADGEIHRFYVEGDKRASKNGWYVLHLGRITAGAYGSWRSGVWSTWCDKQIHHMSDAERWEHEKRIQNIKQQRRELQRQKQRETAIRAEELWASAAPADPDHPYLKLKGVKPYQLRQKGNCLLVPLVDAQGRLWNLQRIFPDGTKRFLTGGRVKHCFSVIPGSNSETVLVCEGFATGATARDLSGYMVLCAMNAKNLQSVAHTASFMGDNQVRICADNDHRTKGNPGLTEGRLAAWATGADLTWPPTCGKNCMCTDFNDVLNCPVAKGGKPS